MFNQIITLIILFTSLFSSVLATAQSPPENNECATVASPADRTYIRNLWQANVKTEKDFLKSANNSNKAPIMIPIKVHIIRTNSGAGGLSTNDLNDAIAVMNGYYVNANMQFYMCGAINYINNSTYYDFNQSDESSLVNANNVSNNINIYFMNSIRTGNSSACGYTRFPGPEIWRNNIMMANSCARNGSTLSHEMGHFYSLYHTHGSSNNGTSDELVNGSNCSTRGDEICDTPADPNLSGLVNGSCLYTGNAVDANRDRYRPEPKNIMSYSLHGCRSLFTPQQYARINSTARNSIYRTNYSCASSNNDAGIKEILQPKNNNPYCSIILNPEVTVQNFGNTSLKSVNIIYQINNDPIKIYSWNGNLAGQQSTMVKLPSLLVPSGSAFTFKAYTSNPNGSSDKNTTNDEQVSMVTSNVDVNTSLNNNFIIAYASPASYRWLDCDNNYAFIPGETNKLYAPPSSGNYAVEVNQNGCIDTSACNNIFIVGLDENALEKQINIYPNPNKGNVNVELGNLTEITIKVSNISGQTVYYKENINTGLHQFKLDKSNGLYFIEVSSENEKQEFKLQILR